MKHFLKIAALLAGLIASPAWAASGTIYVDTGGATSNSGTSDSNSAIISGTAATWTTGTAAITLDVNTNFATVTGCSAGTCDGSQAIFLTNATNTGQKIFWLSSYTGCTGSGACVLTVSQNVTCATCTAQNWAIGGRYLMPGGATANSFDGAMRGGDTVQFNNSPASQTASFYTQRSAIANTSPWVKVIGKTGVVPVLTVSSGANSVINANDNAGLWIENLSLVQSGTGVGVLNTTGTYIFNTKIAPAGGKGVQIDGSGTSIVNCDISSGGSNAGIVDNGNATYTIFGNYIHNTGTDGITITNTTGNFTVSNNLIVSAAGRGIYLNTTPTTFSPFTITGNTIYNSTLAGLEATSTKSITLNLLNNIFYNNGGTTTYNVLFSGGTTAEAGGNHKFNTYFTTNACTVGGANIACVSGLTVNSTEVAADPLFTNAGSLNFNLQSSSPSKGAGYPGTMLNVTSPGFASMGAFQVQATSGGSRCIGC